MPRSCWRCRCAAAEPYNTTWEPRTHVCHNSSNAFCMRWHRCDRPSRKWDAPPANMIHDTFGCFGNSFDWCVRHLDRRSSISFRTSNCRRCHRSRRSVHLSVHCYSRPDTIHVWRWYLHTGQHGPALRRPHQHDTLAPEAYIFNGKSSLIETRCLREMRTDHTHTHSPIQIGSTVCAAHMIFIGGTAMHARRTRSTFTTIWHFLQIK